MQEEVLGWKESTWEREERLVIIGRDRNEERIERGRQRRESCNSTVVELRKQEEES